MFFAYRRIIIQRCLFFILKYKEILSSGIGIAEADQEIASHLFPVFF